jgi:hypothetical protein
MLPAKCQTLPGVSSCWGWVGSVEGGIGKRLAMTKVIKAYREMPLSARQDKRVNELLQRYHLEPPAYLADENFGKLGSPCWLLTTQQTR